MGKDNTLGIGQKIEFAPSNIKCTTLQKKEPLLENEIHKILWYLEIPTDHLILARRPDHESIKKKRKREITCHQGDFTVPVDQRVKIKESEKLDKY